MTQSSYNPDVLSCLANLSNDEVFTPPAVVNSMLDLLPMELWSDPNTTFLDPVSKTGVFLRETAKRLIVGLADKIPDRQERIDHIFSRQLYGLAITELTALVSRRSVYCTKTANNRYCVCSRFNDEQGNIRYRRTEHVWRNGKCRYCGASEAVFGGRDDLETHAYQFIHTDNPEEIFNMKFDVIIGNPPYQLEDGGNGASARPLYHLFVQQAMKLNPRYLCMIIPSRWYAGGKGLEEFRTTMLNSSHIRYLADIADSNDCFPGVIIAGGICYFLWESKDTPNCIVENIKGGNVVSSVKRSLKEFPVFVRDNKAVGIIQKTRIFNSSMMNSCVSTRNSFTVASNERGHKKQEKEDAILFSSNGKSFISKSCFSNKSGILNKYKVVITYAMSGGNKPNSNGQYQILSSLMILKPNEIWGHSQMSVAEA